MRTSPHQPPAPAQPNCHTVTNRGSWFVTSSTPSTHSATTAAYVRRGGGGLHFARWPRKKNSYLLLLLFLLLLLVARGGVEVSCRCCPLVGTGEPRIELHFAEDLLHFAIFRRFDRSEIRIWDYIKEMISEFGNIRSEYRNIRMSEYRNMHAPQYSQLRIFESSKLGIFGSMHIPIFRYSEIHLSTLVSMSTSLSRLAGHTCAVEIEDI